MFQHMILYFIDWFGFFNVTVYVITSFLGQKSQNTNFDIKLFIVHEKQNESRKVEKKNKENKFLKYKAKK